MTVAAETGDGALARGKHIGSEFRSDPMNDHLLYARGERVRASLLGPSRFCSWSTIDGTHRSRNDQPR